MNEEKLIWGAGFIDDDLVCEAIDYKPRRIRLAPWACAAAAAVVLVTAIAVLARQSGSSPIAPPDSADSSYSEDISSVSADSSYFEDISSVSSSEPERDPEQQAVDIGNEMMLTGTMLDKSELEEFSIEPYIGDEYLEADEEFLDSLGNLELKGLYKMAGRLFACLSQSPPKPAFAAAGNERKPAYIITADGKRYEEWGYTYESFYNAFLSAFTKEAAEEIFKEFDFCTNYNGELFFVAFAAGGNVWDGYINEVHREYELISRSDTVIEFRRIAFGCDRDFKPAEEYIPELRDEYIVTYTDFKFVLTEGGWRVASIPVESESTDELSSPEKPVETIGERTNYDDLFEEFFLGVEEMNPTSYGPPLTYEEIVGSLDNTPKPGAPGWHVDSFYLAEVMRVLSTDEAERLKGYEHLDDYDEQTFYEVRIIEDIISGEACDRTAYIQIPEGKGAKVQRRDAPAYASGERFTALISKPLDAYDFLFSRQDLRFRYDYFEEDGERVLYFRRDYPQRSPLDFPTDEAVDITRVTSTTQNPVHYTHKVSYDALAEFLREDWEQRGISSHFDGSSE